MDVPPLVRPEMSSVPPETVLTCAVPPVEVPLKLTVPPFNIEMLAFPAVLELVKLRALLTLRAGAFDEAFVMPVPLIVNGLLIANVNVGAPALKLSAPIETLPPASVRLVVLAVLLNVAVPVGREGLLDQLAALVHSPLADPVQVASVALAGLATMSVVTNATAVHVRKRRR
jgi:hypothetical protein